MVAGKIFLKSFNFSVLRSSNCTYILIYNNLHFMVLKNTGSKKMLLCNSRSLSLRVKGCLGKVDLKSAFRRFLGQFIKYRTYKIRFAGKGYKIKKLTRKSFFFLFNKSHLCIIWWKNMHYKKYKKYKTYIRSASAIKNTIRRILKIRMIDVFTKKGLRLTRDIMYKKKGKK